MSSDKSKISQRDLTATSDEGKIELTERELGRVAGGPIYFGAFQKFLDFNLATRAL
jgi:hypothetical protein